MNRFLRPAVPILFALLSAFLLAFAHPAQAGQKTAIPVLVVSCFEVGEDTGDAPGEFQFWVEREKLTETEEVPGAPHVLRHNAAGLYGIVGGSTKDNGPLSVVGMSELVMALALDPRFDLSHTYILLNGIAGIDPAFGSIGSAVWAKHVVDGDALREIDPREMPKGWPYGLFAIGTTAPNQLPLLHAANGGWGGAQLAYTLDYPLNPGLADWAYTLSSKQAKLDDAPALKAWRDKYTGFPKAQLPPQILLGDTLGSVRYWHGPLQTQWARDWVKLWTHGEGTFATTAMEHQAFMATIIHLGRQGLLDPNRVLMLRMGSNYCMPPPGQGVETTIGDESVGTVPAFEAGYRAGSVVVHELLAHRDQYRDTIPGAAK